MKKKQGSLEIEVAEGGGEIELTVIGKQVSLPLIMSALKERLKSYGIKDLGVRDLTLVLHVPPAPPEDEEEAAKQKIKRDLKYPGHKNPVHASHVNS